MSLHISQIIDPNRPDWVWVTKQTNDFLKAGYLEDGETVQDRFDAFGKMAEFRLGERGLANKVYRLGARAHFSPSSPVWASAGRIKGLPISCNNSYFGDSIEEFANKLAEMMVMTKHGAGTSAWIGDMRHRGSSISTGGIAFGPAHYAPMIESVVKTTSQKGYRRGSWAGYFNIDHPDALELIEKFQSDDRDLGDTPFGITIPDWWFERVLDCVLNGNMAFQQEANLWLRILKKKIETGYPYLVFDDNVNKYSPDIYQKLGRKILGSNLCSEIFLSSTADESFVCDLGSMNLLYWNEIKADPDIVHTSLKVLDAVMSEYIDKTEHIKHMEAPRRFAINQRAVGLGVLGLHSLYQLNDLPFGSHGAYALNEEIFDFLDRETLKASYELAKKFGPAPIYGDQNGPRNVTRIAIAPTKSSSSIFGEWLSQGIQPFSSNYVINRRAKGQTEFKNPFLEMKLEKLGLNTKEVWQQIAFDSGSVQKIKELDRHTKRVYETFREIDQFDVVLQAAQRQRHIDQGQSTNLSYDSDTPTREISRNYIAMWRLGAKSAYYQNNKKIALTANQEAAKHLAELRKAAKAKLGISTTTPIATTSSAADDFGVDCVACSA